MYKNKLITANAKSFLLCLIVFTITGCSNSKETVQLTKMSADTIYYGGSIVTMAGDKPNYIESVVVKDGKIIFVGKKAEADKKYKGEYKNLNGNTLLPGFIDGHGHVYNVGISSLYADVLPPPDGPGESFESIVKTTKDWMVTDNGKLVIEKFGWIVANGYDDSQLIEKDHPTKEILDQISTEIPVMIVHQSGHLGAVNTIGLKTAGYTNESENPDGGLLRRNQDGSLSGVLEEAAMFNVLMPLMDRADNNMRSRIVKNGQLKYAESGYTTAQDGRTTEDASASFITSAEKGEFFIDVVSYPDIIWNIQAVTPEYYSRTEYNNGYRVGGVKLTLDGSPQGKTAWLTKHYEVPPTGQADDYKGYPIMSDEDATKWVKKAYENDWQMLAHINGDAAIDQFIKAIDAAQKEFGYNDHRSVIIHAQTIRKDQIPDVVRLNLYPSLFPMHTFYWGDWHRESVLGEERAAYISPTRDVIDAGLTITSHHDAPVTFPNSMRVLDATVNRVTRSGYVLGPDQRITPYEGLKSLTYWSAIQYFEEDSKGTIEVGKLADFVILNQDPLKMPSLEIKDIQVLETIKENKTVFKK